MATSFSGRIALCLLAMSLAPTLCIAGDPPFRISRLFPHKVDDIGKKPRTAKDGCVEELARNIDWLEHHINMNGTVVAKTPDVWGEARLTAHRQEFEDVLKKELYAFEKNSIQGAEFVSDQAFLAFAIAASNRRAGSTTVFPSITQSAAASDSTTVGEDGKPTISQSTQFSGPPNAFGYNPDAFNVNTIKIEQTEVLDQLANYVNHLHALRRKNEGPDTADAPGYSMNLVRVPVSILPGHNTKLGHGAEITMTAEPYLGPELLPQAYREFVVNDLVDQLSVAFAQYLNGDPEEVRKEMNEARDNTKDIRVERTEIGSLQKTIGALEEHVNTLNMSLSVNYNAAYEQDRKHKQEEITLKKGEVESKQASIRLQKSGLAVYKNVRTSLTITSLGGGSTTRRSTYPFPPSQLLDNFGEDEIISILCEVYDAFVKDLINRDVVHVSDLQAFLREETAGAYELLSQPSMQPLWDMDNVAPHCKLSELIRTRKVKQIEERREQFLGFIDDQNASVNDHKNEITCNLAWCLYVNSLLLNERVVRDINTTYGNTPNTPPAPGWLPYYGPHPPPEARQAFAEYVKIRWPIHVFALDPEINEQNITDVRSIYRQMQLSVAVSYATGNIGISAALQAMRKLQRDRATIDLKRLAIAFGHGDDTFGWRFTPRFQTPRVESNSKVFFRDLIVGGPTDRQLEAGEALEPGMRECSAIVIMPSFVPHVTFHSRGNWYKLNSPTRTGDSVHDTVHYSRAIKQMEYNAQMCCQCAHLYRDGEIERLLKRVHQLDRKLALQTLECQVPIENTHGGFELMTGGKRELAPELTGWYGAPGYDVERGTHLFLSGDSFSVTQNRLIIGNRLVEGKLLSRQILQVELPPGLAVMRDRKFDSLPTERYSGYIDAQVASPYGVSGHMLIPVVRTDGGSTTPVLAVRPNLIKIVAQLKGDPSNDRKKFTVDKFIGIPSDINFLRVDVPAGDGLRQQNSVRALLFGKVNGNRILDADAIVLSTDDGGASFADDGGELGRQFTATSGKVLGVVFKGHIEYLLTTGGDPKNGVVSYQLGVGLTTFPDTDVKLHPLLKPTGSINIEVELRDPPKQP